MAGLREIVTLRTMLGEPVTFGDVTVTPQSQALVIRWPGRGYVYNRPVAVLVTRGEETERIPIMDVTRLIQLAMLAIGVAFAVSVLVSAAGRKGK